MEFAYPPLTLVTLLAWMKTKGARVLARVAASRNAVPIPHISATRSMISGPAATPRAAAIGSGSQ